MKYIIYGSMVFFMVACGNQHEGQGALRLVGKEKTESVIVAEKIPEIKVGKKEDNRTLIKSENLLLAELEARSKWELMNLESQETKELKAFEKEVTLVKLTNEREIERSKLLTEKEITLATLENNKDIVIAEHETRVKTQDKDNALYELITYITAGIVILFMLVLFLMHRRSKKMQMKLHADELRHKEMLEANKQHNENVRKMLEIVADENADNKVKKEIVRLLRDQQSPKEESLLIEHK